MQVLIERRATAAEMRTIKTRDGSCYYWTDQMDSLVGKTFEVKRVRDDSVMVSIYRVPLCVVVTAEKDSPGKTYQYNFHSRM